MSNPYFNLGLYKYVLGTPILFLLAMLSLRYYTLKYEATFDEMKQYINHSILRVITPKIDHLKLYNYFSNRYDLPLRGVTQARIAFVLMLVLIETIMLKTLLDFTDFDQMLPPTLFWSGLYLISFILCWRFGSRLKNYVKD